MDATKRRQETMTIFPSPFMDATEDNIVLDSSTAPTTPEGSYLSSPVLRPQISALMEIGITQTRPVQNICCVGAGYVGKQAHYDRITGNRVVKHMSRLGGPTAAVIAFNNPHIRVTVVDLNTARIRRWQTRHPPIYEPGLEDILRVARDGTQESVVDCDGTPNLGLQRNTLDAKLPARQPNLFFSTEVGKCISEADIVLIAVNTPTKTKGRGAGRATDMAAFEAVTADVAIHAKANAIVVEKSTVPCRTAQMVRETVSALLCRLCP